MAGAAVSAETEREREPEPAALRAPTTRVEELQAQLELAQLKLKGIEEISRALGSEHNIDRILDTVMERTTGLVGAERATLFLVDEREGVLWSRNTQGGEVETIEVPVGTGIAGWVAAHGRTVNVKDAYKDPRFNAAFDERTGFRTRSVLCAPLVDSQARVIGAIQVLNKGEGYFTPADEDLLGAIASQAAISIHNSKLYLDIVGKNIDLMETSMRLEARGKELELLFRIERAAATATAIDQAMEGVISATLEEFPSEAAGVAVIDRDTDSVRWGYVVGEHSDALSAANLAVGKGLVGTVLSTGKAMRVTRRGEEVPELAAELGPGDWPIRHAVAVPITHKQQRLGALVLVNRTNNPRGFTDADERLLTLIASRLGLSFVLANAIEEDQKAERLAAIGQMLSGVIHDLKTPLTIMSGYARAMVGEERKEVRQEHRERIKKQIALVKEMTRELMAFARGDSEVLFRKVFIRTFLDEIAELLRGEFAGSGIELLIEDRFGGTLRMDEQKIKRVIYNMARNAREAMATAEGEPPRGSHFIIRVEADEDVVRLSFIDDGPGIPPEVQARLFEPFVTHGKSNGTGLGLAIVQQIAEEHGGTIRVDTAVGEGTTFELSIPRSL